MTQPQEPPRRPKPITMEQAEKVASVFHQFYEELAPKFGYETRQESAVPWEQVPENNRNLMIATTYALLDGGWIMDLDSDETHALVECLMETGVTMDEADAAPVLPQFKQTLVTAFGKLAFANGRHYGLTNFDMGIEEDEEK
jgi:hypothetical protein